MPPRIICPFDSLTQVLNSSDLDKGAISFSPSLLIDKGILHQPLGHSSSSLPNSIVLVDDKGLSWRCLLTQTSASQPMRDARDAAEPLREGQSGGCPQGASLSLVGLSDYFDQQGAGAGDMLRIGDGRPAAHASHVIVPHEDKASGLLSPGPRILSVRLLKRSDVLRISEILPL